jgi:hypothetical protein
MAACADTLLRLHAASSDASRGEAISAADVLRVMLV